MDEQHRKELVQQAEKQNLQWRGAHATIGGWKNYYASIASDLGGFWGIRWEDLERVLNGESTLDQENVWFVSGAWLGVERPS